jgi:two-component system, cell cycle sensor histidine kinase and response regulator CckA
MSGYTENVVTSGGLLEEGLAFLQKPFSPSALLHKIRDVLSHTPTA